MIDIHYAAADDYTPEKLDRCLAAILSPVISGYGGLSGKSVMIKPNLLEYRKENDPASVHPQLLAALCRYLQANGASEIAIVENPAVRTADAIVEAMGISADISACGTVVKNCRDYQKSSMPVNCRYHRIEVAAEYRKYDLVIDFAKAKTHAMMVLTCGVKNLFGLVRGSERLAWHLAVGRNFDDFADMLLDLYLLVKPHITLLDAIVGMEGNGPGSGDAVELGFLAASSDALALDLSVAERLGATDIPVLNRAKARGLAMEFRNCGEVPEIHPVKLPEVPEPKLEWGVYFPVKLRVMLRSMLVSKPVVERKKCIACGLCVQKCPPQTLKLNNGKLKFDYSSCIRCFCCQEFCPKGAITVEKSRWMKLLSFLEKVIRKLNITPKSRRKP